MSAHKLEIRMPVPYTVNSAYVKARGRKGRVLTGAARDFKNMAGWDAKRAALEQDWCYNGGRLHIELYIVFPSNHRRDISNCLKLAEDAVAEALDFDDTVVDSVFIKRSGVDPDNPHALFCLWEEPDESQ